MKLLLVNKNGVHGYCWADGHRHTERPGLEGTSRIVNLQPHLLHQAAQGPIQPGLEHLQGWGIHNLSGQPVPAPHHSPGKELKVTCTQQPLHTTNEEDLKDCGMKQQNPFFLPVQKWQQFTTSKSG